MTVVYAPEAIRDLQNLKESVIEKFCDIALADTIIVEITKKIRYLELFPQMGTELIFYENVKMGYRYLFCKRNYIFYRVEGETIFILRVLHEKQDYMEILFNNTDKS